MRRLPPMDESSPPTITVGSSPADMAKVAVIEVVEVLPCVPEMQTTF